MVECDTKNTRHQRQCALASSLTCNRDIEPPLVRQCACMGRVAGDRLFDEPPLGGEDGSSYIGATNRLVFATLTRPQRTLSAGDGDCGRRMEHACEHLGGVRVGGGREPATRAISCATQAANKSSPISLAACSVPRTATARASTARASLSMRWCCLPLCL